MQGSSPAAQVLLQTLMHQLPYLLVLLGGLVVTIVFMSRCRGPAIVAAVGIMAQLLAIVLLMAAQFFFFNGPTRDMAARASIMGAVFLFLNVLRAAGIAAILGAVLMERAPAENAANR